MPVTTSKTKAAGAKPYDRPAKGKGKAKADGIGAPAQPKQSSRKGKNAWRKNVDITAEEAALEAARAEERLTGGKVETRSNDALFTIDTEGDVAMTQQIRRKREKKPLRSLAVLNERSAVPSLTSRPRSSTLKHTKISSAEKKRLRRTALKAESDRTAASSLKAVDTPAADPWVAPKAAGLPGGWGDEGVVKPAPKAPETLSRQRELRRAVDAAQLEAELPRAGISYNPSAPAHAALIEEAIAEEMTLLAAEERVEAAIVARGGVVEAFRNADTGEGEEMVGGMRIGRGDGVAEESESESDEEEGFKPKPTKRKTQAQRNKVARAKAQLLAEREEANRRRMERHVGAAKSMSKSVAAKAREAEEAARQRRAAAKARERAGYAGGEKVGKHRVQKGAVAVQLGEDLAESLRQLKGNLFKDRFQSLQRRALIEPRVPQLPKKRKVKIKEYEKFAWKRFE